MVKYTKQFYRGQRDGSRRSAWGVIPEVLKFIKPRRVIDVGCGVGTWLFVFKEHGVEKILGIDGDYVDQKMQLILRFCRVLLITALRQFVRLWPGDA